MNAEVNPWIGNCRCPKNDHPSKISEIACEKRNKENRDSKWICSMRRNKSKSAATFTVYQMNQCSNFLVVAWARPLYQVFYKHTQLIRNQYHQCNQQQNPNSVLPVFFNNKKNEKQIKRYPEKAIAHPEHQNIKKWIMKSIQEKEKLGVEILKIIYQWN